MLAGCSTDTTGTDPDSDGSSSDDTDSGASATGTFRLLISDQPVAIDDFDELNVSFDRARVFPENGAEDGESEPGADGEEDERENGSTEDGEPEDDGAENEDQRGFRVIDLDGATVDLTQVLGDKAISVFEGNLEEGRYTKVELYAVDVEGIVEGEPVEVKIPSGKLQIVKPFEVVAGETLSFVFDINVVKKGQQQEYNLLPVISDSGVAGQDVAAEEIEGETPETAGSDGPESETEDPEGTDSEAEESGEEDSESE